MSGAMDVVDNTDGIEIRRPDAAVTPPMWVAALAIAGALGLSLSLALPPTTKVSGGAIRTGSAPAEKVEEVRRPGEVFIPPLASADE